MSKSSVILFLPETGIYPFLRGLAVLGDALQKNGDEVHLVSCTGQMIRCSMMAKEKLPINATIKDKNKLCAICIKGITAPLKSYGFSKIDLIDFVDESLYIKINNLLNVPVETWNDLKYDEFPVGKVAEYDFSLESKHVVYPNMSDDHLMLYKNYIKNTILAVELGKRICNRHNPSLVLTFNPYAQCQGFCFSAKMQGIEWNTLTYATHFNVDTSLFLICKSMSLHLLMNHISNWKNESETPILPQYVKECWEDTIFRTYQSGSHIFSSRKSADPLNIFNALKLNSNLKTIVAYTSSYDELAGLETIMHVWGEDTGIKHIFRNQIEWLKWLNNYSLNHTNIQIVVRIHPREGNRQFGFSSKHLGLLQENFSMTTDRFHIIWPDDPYSSYDLMELADLCLIPWTNMGLEVARVGIPVLTYTSNMYYPNDDFIQLANTIEDYENKIESMLQMEYRWEHLVKAIRFYHWRTFVPSINFRKTVPSNFHDNSVWPSVSESSAGTVCNILCNKQNLFEYNINNWHSLLPFDAKKRELDTMCLGIRMFLDVIFYYSPKSNISPNFFFRVLRRIWLTFTGKILVFNAKSARKFYDYQLTYSEDISKLSEFTLATKNNTTLRIIIKDGLNSILLHNGRSKKRMSPMVNRLAKIYSTCK